MLQIIKIFVINKYLNYQDNFIIKMCLYYVIQ